MATEEQTELQYPYPMYAAADTRIGQRLTISNREVSKLGFWLNKANSPTGTVTLTIRKVSDDAVLLSKDWGDAGDLPVETTYKEVTFDSPLTINEEVRISAEFAGGDATNQVKVNIKLSDVKADEFSTNYDPSTWTDGEGYDCAYKYTYEEAGGAIVPVVVHHRKMIGVE